jgi:hypothetical protein
MGEFDIDRIVELLDSGEFMWTDHCWHKGLTGWAPLDSLRSEVAAAKAFPPVAAMPGPVASGRRRTPPPAATASPVPKASVGFSGWWWIFSGVTLGALTGLLATYLFPTVVQVDRVVEKVVEKPVEVVRVVERPVEVIKVVDKSVEVPAALTPEQREAVVLMERLNDPERRTAGVGLFNVSEKIKVIYGVEGRGSSHLNSGAIVSRVESAFKGHGFTVLPRDFKGAPFSIVKITGLFLEDTNSQGNVMSISGGYRITISQPALVMNPFDKETSSSREIKIGMVDLYSSGGAIDYGSNNFYKVPDVFARAAEDCAREMRRVNGN